MPTLDEHLRLWQAQGVGPEDVALERLGPDDWDVVCHAEDELRRARSGGFSRAWPPPPFRYDLCGNQNSRRCSS